MEIVWFVVAAALCAGSVWVGIRLEPHFVSKDGSRMLCMGQKLTPRGDPDGRWRETRLVIDHSGRLQVDQKRHLRRTTTFWTVESRAPEAPARKAVFLLRGHDDEGLPARMAVRLPVSSRGVASLDALARPARTEGSPHPTAGGPAPEG